MVDRKQMGRLWCTALVVATLWAASSSAAVPSTVAIEGRLLTAGGGPVADGDYDVTFSLYADSFSKQATWTEVAKVKVVGGAFRHALGSVKALTAAGVTAAKARWLGVRVGQEAELSRNAIDAVPYALRSAVAEAISCSGCVAVSALKPDGDLDLKGNAIKAKQITATTVNTATVIAQSFVGDGSKLTGIKLPKGACAAGQVVIGVLSNGGLQCGGVAGAAGGSLEQISGGLLTTAYSEPVISKNVPIAIPDNNPIGVADVITVPDVGPAKELSISLEISNSNINGLKVVLYDSNNASYVLHDGGGKGGLLKATYPDPTKPVSGDLTQWVGKNPKGKWRLRVIDSKFLNNKTDGALKAWSINLLSANSKQVTSKGVLVANGGFFNQKSSGPPTKCSASKKGVMYFNTKDKRLYYCDGDWRKLLIEPLCGNKVINPGEACDDGNIKDGDGCTAKCQTNVCGDGVLWKGKEDCDDGNKNDKDLCSNSCKLTNCLKSWKLLTPCNGKMNPCVKEETGYHFKGIYNQNGQKWACWWHTKNQAWNITPSTNFHSLAKHFKLQTGVGGSKWCHAKSANPCSVGTCANSQASYFNSNQVGAWGWCGGNNFSSGGFVCIPPGNIPACVP